MKLYVIDFEEVLKNFSSYHKSLEKINEEKSKFSNEIESIKKEMESIVTQSKSLLLDESIQMSNANKFKSLQTKAIKLESEFRNDIVELQNTELERNFKDISDIVDEWSVKNEADIVFNKTQTIYVSNKYDATNDIIKILKDKNLFQEYKEEETLILS